MTDALLLTYEDVLAVLYDEIHEPVLVPNLGTNTAAAMRLQRRPDALYMWGGMGLTHALGLGLAVAQPERTVAVLDGDGSLLMGLSGLATIAVEQPANFLHLVLDNGAWGNTGGQGTHTAMGVRLDDVASACGYVRTTRTRDVAGLRDALTDYRNEPMCSLILVEIRLQDPGPAPDQPDPVGIKRTFMHSLGAPSH